MSLLKRIEPHLVDDWREARNWLSVWAMSATAAGAAAWEAIPQAWRDAVPDHWKAGAVGAMMVLGVAGRMLKQPSGNSDAGSA